MAGIWIRGIFLDRWGATYCGLVWRRSHTYEQDLQKDGLFIRFGKRGGMAVYRLRGVIVAGNADLPICSPSCNLA
jgi:hypothetical protein